MKRLLILRHAKSSWKDADLADHDRPLNERGKRDAPRMGQLLREQELRPDLILSSTARRARSTAKKIVKSSGYDVEIQLLAELYHAHPATHVEVLGQQAGPHSCVMIVAHNPGLQELLAALVGEYHEFPTAALAQVELPISSWNELTLDTPATLRNLWYPRQLA